MKAMIFAAGMGTRLRPLTDNIPKALVRVGGIPLLQRIILKLAASGFNDITINIHHRGQQIIDFLQANKNFGQHINISDERGQLLNTGGGIRHAQHFLTGDEPFLVHNVDILTDADLKALWQHHLLQKSEATLLVGKRQTKRYLLFDKNMNLHGWTNKQTGEIRPTNLAGNYEEWAFAGIHILSPSLFRYMNDSYWQEAFSIIDFYLNICPYTPIKGVTICATHWFDTGTPETLACANSWYEQLH